jgi:hypothetical protein
MTSIPSSHILLSLKPLRRDGIFVKDIEFLDEKGIEFCLTLANYITDTDDGRDVECLYEKGDIDDGSCYCEGITCGSETPDDKCVPCPFCGVPTKRHTLKERLYTANIEASLEKGVQIVSRGTASTEMLYRVSWSLCDAISQVKKLLPRIDLSGGPCPSYGE